MELVIKNGDREAVIEQERLLDVDYGTSIYGFKFDEKCVPWDKSRASNKFFLEYQQNYFDDLLRRRGYLFLNEVYEQLGVARTAIGQCVGWVFDPENPVGDNYVCLDIDSDRNNNDENVFILDPNVDGFILDRI